MTERQREAFEAAIRDGMERAGVPPRYIDVPAANWLGRDLWGYVTGCVGCGKTYTAAGLLRDYLERHVYTAIGCDEFFATPAARFITAGEYLDEVRKGYGNGGAASAIRDAEFLVIDDLGQEVPTKWAVAELFHLINHRYNRKLITVITSQFSRGEIARRLAENGGEEQALAIASRLAECCVALHPGDKDRRLECQTKE